MVNMICLKLVIRTDIFDRFFLLSLFKKYKRRRVGRSIKAKIIFIGIDPNNLEVR
jgi:hypothetical protein